MDLKTIFKDIYEITTTIIIILLMLPFILSLKSDLNKWDPSKDSSVFIGSYSFECLIMFIKIFVVCGCLTIMFMFLL